MKAIIGLGEIKELLKTDRAVRLIVGAGAAILLLIALGSLFGQFGSSGKTDNASVSGKADREMLEEYEHTLEQRLSDILSDIDGVGEAKVMVTLDTSGHTEFGKNADMLISVTAPEVRGVIVVCDGGDSVAVKEKVIDAVSGVFGINTLRISVAGSK